MMIRSIRRCGSIVLYIYFHSIEKIAAEKKKVAAESDNKYGEREPRGSVRSLYYVRNNKW